MNLQTRRQVYNKTTETVFNYINAPSFNIYGFPEPTMIKAKNNGRDRRPQVAVQRELSPFLVSLLIQLVQRIFKRGNIQKTLKYYCTNELNIWYTPMELISLLSFARIVAFKNVCYFGPPCTQAHDRVGPCDSMITRSPAIMGLYGWFR